MLGRPKGSIFAQKEINPEALFGSWSNLDDRVACGALNVFQSQQQIGIWNSQQSVKTSLSIASLLPNGTLFLLSL